MRDLEAQPEARLLSRIAQLDQRTALPDQCLRSAEADVRPPSLSSRPEGFHLRALPEPYVNLSIHTAPDVRPLP